MHFPNVTFSSASGPGKTARTSRQVARAYAAGSLVRLRRGVYADIDAWLSGNAADRYAITAASLAMGGQPTVLCRETALMAWGAGLVHVPTHVRRRTDRRAAAGAVPVRGLYGNDADAQRRWREQGRSGAVPPGFPDARHLGPSAGSVSLFVPHLGLNLAIEPFDVVFVDTIPRLSFAEGVPVVDALLAQHPALKVKRSLDDLRRLCAGMLNRSAQTRLTQVLDFADGDSESVGESLSRALMWELGFEMPRLQVWITQDGRRIARVDYFWDRLRLAGEFDGLQKYLRSQELSGKSAAEAVIAEKRREDEIRATGCGMVRWVWADLLEPTRFATILHRAGVPRRI